MKENLQNIGFEPFAVLTCSPSSSSAANLRTVLMGIQHTWKWSVRSHERFYPEPNPLTWIQLDRLLGGTILYRTSG